MLAFNLTKKGFSIIGDQSPSLFGTEEGEYKRNRFIRVEFLLKQISLEKLWAIFVDLAFVFIFATFVQPVKYWSIDLYFI